MTSWLDNPTEDRTFVESNLCTLGPRPQIMTGLLMSLLREHFASADNIEHAVFRQRLFTKVAGAEDTTGIMIEDASVWTPNRSGKRPAILVKRNAWEHQKRLTLDASAGTTDAGDPQYVKLWRGSHTIFCVAKSCGEVETLVAETYRFFMHFGPVIMEWFNLLMFELLEVGAPAMVDEANQYWAVPITIAYGWDELWTVRQWMPVLKDVRLSDVFAAYYDPPAPQV